MGMVRSLSLSPDSIMDPNFVLKGVESATLSTKCHVEPAPASSVLHSSTDAEC